MASATETVHALGCGSRLVGRSHECDHPPGVRDLPQVSEPRFEIDLSSREIDRSVKDLLREALGIYRVDAGLLRELAPDVILTQTQCEVCAVSPGDLDRALCEWMPESEPTVVHLEPNTLSDIREDMRKIARALEVPDRGDVLVEDIETRMSHLSDRARAPAPTGNGAAEPSPTVAYIEWIDPLMAGGNWMPELVSLAGGEPLFVGPGEHSPTLGWESVMEADPDVVFVSPCGYGLERTREDVELLEALPGWSDLRAVREGRAFYADANAFLTRPGPRVVESLRILCEILHPEVFPPTLQGVAWDRR
ncbi:MAG: cobalamin-binding protein [Longimicrobiales bacterium]